MIKVSLDQWKRNKKLKLIKKAFGGKNGNNKQKSSSNGKRKTR